MTTYKGTNFGIVEAPTPTTVLPVEKVGGKIHAITDVYQGAVDTASIIKMGRMPKGAIPLFGFINFSGSATTTLSVGYPGATQCLGTATALATTPKQTLYPNKSQWGTPLTAAVDVYLSVNTKALGASDKIFFTYCFTKD